MKECKNEADVPKITIKYLLFRQKNVHRLQNMDKTVSYTCIILKASRGRHHWFQEEL